MYGISLLLLLTKTEIKTVNGTFLLIEIKDYLK